MKKLVIPFIIFGGIMVLGFVISIISFIVFGIKENGLTLPVEEHLSDARIDFCDAEKSVSLIQGFQTSNQEQSESFICLYEEDGEYAVEIQNRELSELSYSELTIDENTYFDIVTQVVAFIDQYEDQPGVYPIGTCRTYESLVLQNGDIENMRGFGRMKNCGEDNWLPEVGSELFTDIRDQILEAVSE